MRQQVPFWNAGFVMILIGAVVSVLPVLSAGLYFAPHIGLANAALFVLIAELVTVMAVNRLGWLGAIRTPLEARRALGSGDPSFGIHYAKRPV